MKNYIYEGSFIRLLVTVTGEASRLQFSPTKKEWVRTQDTLKATCVVQDMRQDS